jgi:hypothetical protein
LDDRLFTFTIASSPDGSFMPRTSPSVQLNDFLVFGPESERFAVSEDVTVALSSVYRDFRRHLQSSGPGYQLQSEVSRESVLEFVKTLVGSRSEISWTNAADLCTLCEELKLEALRLRIDEFVMQNSNGSPDSVSRFLSFALSLCKRGLSCEFLTGKLRGEFLSLIDDPHFHELPLPLLDQVVDFGRVSDRASFRRLLEFCVTFVDRRGADGSILFRTIEPVRLTPSDILLIGDRGRFVYPFMSDSITSSVLDCVQFKSESDIQLQAHRKDISELKDRADSLSSRLTGLEGDQRTFVKLSAFEALSSEVERMNQVLSRQSELESTILALRSIAATKAELELTSSNCLPKGEFASFQSHVSGELARIGSISASKSEFDSFKVDCSRKSEFASLRDSVVSKSELTSELNGIRASVASRADCTSLKSELNTLRSALDSLRSASSSQSDLNSLKSEFNSFKSTAATKSDIDSLRSSLTPKPWIPFFSPPGHDKPWNDLRGSVARYG